MVPPQPLHAVEADIRARSEIMLADLLGLADPAEIHRADLRIQGVAPATIAALYPVELTDVIAGWRALLTDPTRLAACNPLLVEREFETAVGALPWSLASLRHAELEALGFDDEAKWAGAFAVANHELNADWLTYQFGNLFAFVHELATAPTLEPEIFMPLGNTPDPELYDSAWRMLGLWIDECETVVSGIMQTVTAKVTPCTR